MRRRWGDGGKSEIGRAGKKQGDTCGMRGVRDRQVRGGSGGVPCPGKARREITGGAQAVHG